MAKLLSITTDYGRISIFHLGKTFLGRKEDFTQFTQEKWNEYTQSQVKKFLNFQEKQWKGKIFSLNQVHGNQIFTTHPIPEKIPEGDGLVTFHEKEVLIVRTADCVPLYFWSLDRPMVGILHIGWRGAKEGILENCIQNYFRKEERIGFGIGPSIRGINYEVGEEVARFFQSDSPYFPCIQTKNHRLYLDIPQYIQGIILKHCHKPIILDEGLDTYGSSEWFSHRYQEWGRNIHGIYFSLY